MVGLLINTLPVRVWLDPAQSLARLLATIQDEQSALIPYQHLGLADIQRLAGLGALFDTSIVFQNYPGSADTLDLAGTGLRMTGAEGRDAYHYPLKLMAAPAERLYLELSYRPEFFARVSAERLVARLRLLLEAIAADPGAPTGQFTVIARAEREEMLRAWPGDAPVRPSLRRPGPAPAADHRPPRTPQEELLCSIFADILGAGEVGIDDNFFDLGGDSVLALQLAGRTQAQFGLAVPVRAVFDAPTAADLAKFCTASLDELRSAAR